MRAAVLLVALCLLLSFAAGCAQETPEQVLASYIALWEAEDYEGMYTYLSSQAKEAWDAEVFISRHKNISRGIGLTQLKLADVTCREGIVNYSLQFSTLSVGEFRQQYSLEMVREGGNWRLNWDHCHIFPDLTSQRVVRVRREMPIRGDILDCNQVPLAAADTVYEVGLVPGNIVPETIDNLSLLLGKPSREVLVLLEQSWVREDSFVPVATVDQDTWSQLRQPLTALPGVLAKARNGRVYNFPESLAQTIGYIGEAEGDNLEKIKALGFEAGDLVGLCGLEQSCNQRLLGRPGAAIEIRDDNNIVAEVAQRPVIHGEDVITTLDVGKIRKLDAALGEWSGSMLLLDCKRGSIIGVVSKPGFDCNLFVRGISSSQYQELLAQNSPFLNRAFNALYPPGSVFKPFTALMALEEKVFDPDYSWDTPQHWQGAADWGGYRVTRVLRPPGPVDLWEAMRWSDNVYFADLGLKIGWPAFSAYAGQLGFGEKMPFALNYERSQFGQGEGSVLLADSSYGQGKMLTTPLHMSLLYAALARGDGILPRPSLLAEEEPAPWLETGFQQQNLDLLDRVLAYTAAGREVQVTTGDSSLRGKTGTSEISQEMQIAWYICYFDDYVLAVTLEGDSSLSSTQAVEVARECLDSGIRDQGY